ncbi:MAG: hypothetical protein WC314_26600 [Vulcanimicrobiota bacterium]
MAKWHTLDKWQKAYVIFALLVLLWLGSKQRAQVSRSQPSPRQRLSASQLSNKTSQLAPGWGVTERTSTQIRKDLAQQTERLLLASSSIKAVVDSQVREQALSSVQPFEVKLWEIENASATFFDPVEKSHGVARAAGAGVVGSSVRGRSSPSRSSSSSSYSHK